MSLRATALALVLTAQPALALSCLEPDLARSFNDAVASNRVYSVVLGQFRFDTGAVPQGADALRSHRIPARFNGRVLGPDGFNRDILSDVTLDIQCVAETWCGGAGAPGERTLAFLRHDAGSLVLDLDPCGHWIFPRPTNAQIERAGECLTGGACP